MKRIILSIVMVLAVGSIMAQKQEVEALSKVAGIEYTKLPKNHLVEMARKEGGITIGNKNLSLLNIQFDEVGSDQDVKNWINDIIDTFFKNVDYIHVLNTKSESARQQINATADAIEKKNECIMSTNEDGEKIKLIQCKKGVVGIIEDDEDVSLMYIEGKFNFTKTINKLSKIMQDAEVTLPHND